MQRVAIYAFAFIAAAISPATVDACVPAISSPIPYGYVRPTAVPTSTPTTQEQIDWQRAQIDSTMGIADIVFQGKAIMANYTYGVTNNLVQTEVVLVPVLAWKGSLPPRVEVRLPLRQPMTDCDFLSLAHPSLIAVWFIPDVEYLIYAWRTATGTFEALPRTRAISDATLDLTLLGPGIALAAPSPSGHANAAVASAPQPARLPTRTADSARSVPVLLIVGGALVSVGIMIGARRARRRHAKRLS